MMVSFWKTIALLAALLLQDAAAQQFLGDVIPNVTYPSVPGSELAYFRVKDPAGKNNNLTLVNYQSFGSNGKRINPLKVQRAVIIIHGLNRDAGTYMSNMLSALSQVKSDSNINFDSVVINAPSFPNGDDKNVSYPYWDYPPGAKKKASGGAQSWTNLLVWKGSQWAGGGTSQYPTKATGISSYDVLDQLVQYYSDKSVFPNIKQIVVAGHSLGAQTTQRYAAVGKPASSLGVTVPVTYWIANPNSLVWLNSSRPLSTASCADYDEWRDGLSAYAAYPSVYNTDLVASGDDAVLANYESKNKAYARGTLDMGDDSSGCAPFTTGSNRHERFYYFINWWTPTCEAPSSASGHCDTIDLVAMGHDGGGMMASAAGQARLFTDNFYGDGARSYDFGYPRIQSNVDDPYPNPAYNQTSSSLSDTVYAGNMTFQGCYTDSGSRTLANMVYDSTSNTVDKCTAACVAAGYSIAGMEYGSQCWCDKQLGPYTQKALDLGCSQACPGNSSQICGQSNRLSIYSNGAPTQGSAPSNPEVVGNYYYSGCHSEISNGRALSATSYSDGKNMTLENCAAFCNGYQYFGIEYAAECYCGSKLATGSAILADSSCSMLCTGNSLELCGGPGALTVYQLSADAPVSTIIQGSTTAGSSPTNTGTSTVSSLPSASLCPATNGQTVADSNNITYTVGCSSDTNIGSYASAQAANSYFDCMVACDNAASSNCVAFTYVGGTNGQGSGTCYLKNSQGSFSAAASNLVSGFKSSSGSTTGTVTASTSASTSAPSSSSLCPATNGQTIADANNITYTIGCSSDTNIGSYSSAQAVSSYFDCMTACDAASSSGCVAFTYVGGTYGQGSGTCYLKNSQGSFSAAASNLVSGFKSSSGSTGGSATTSTTSAAPAATTYADGSTPTVGGVQYAIEVNVTYSGTTLTLSKKRAAVVIGDCLNTCAGSSACVGTSFDGTVCTYYGSIDSSTKSSAPGTTFATVKARASATSSSAAATASSTLCPSVDSQDILDSNGNTYTIKCSSDTTIGSFANAQAANTYADCMTACDSTTGCVAFTYVGGANGQGSGTCWMKNARGSASSAGGNNYIAGFLKQAVSSSSSSASSSSASSALSTSAVSSTVSSTSVSSSATASSVATLCPQANGQLVTDSNGNLYNVTCSADNSVGSYSNTQASSSYIDCMAACDAAASTGCQGFTYVGGAYGQGSGTCWLKQSMANYPASGNNVISAVKVKQNLASSSSASSSSSSAAPSSSSSTVSSSSSTVSSSSSTVSSSSSTVSSSSSTVSSSSSLVSASSSTVSTSSSAVSSSSSTDSSSSSTVSTSSIASATSQSSSSTVSSSSAATSSSSSVASTSSSSTVSTSSASVTSSSSSAISSSSSASPSSSSVATTLSTSTASASATSTTLSLPTGFSSYGCFVDGSTRALAYNAYSRSDNTPYKCASTCQSLGYKYAGTEYGSECWCANTAPSTSTKATDCSMSCSGDKTQTCGAGNRLSVYVDNSWTQKFSARASYGSWNLMACYVDGGSGRVLPQTMSMTGGSNNATIANCLDACAKSGLRVCGAEYYSECYGGSVAPSSSLIAGSDPLTSGCNYPCSGNKTEACGGSNRILVYINNGTLPSR